MYGYDYTFDEIFIYFPRENIFGIFVEHDTMYFEGFDKRYGKQSILEIHTSCRIYFY